jgi:transglutaminase-like putative cysteine protease
MHIEELEQLSLSKKCVLFFVAGLLFLEVLKPLADMTGTKGTGSFFAAFTLFLFLREWRGEKWAAGGLALIFSWWLLVDLFHPSFHMWQLRFFTSLPTDLLREGTLLASGKREPEGFPVFRTVLFLVLLWLLSGVWRRWFLHAGRVIVPFVLTLTFLIVTDLLTNLEVSGGAVRVLLYALLTLSWIRWQALLLRFPLLNRVSRGWVEWTVFVLALCLAVGAYLPSFPEKNRAYTLVWAGGGGEGGGWNTAVKRIGYSSNDDRLGGPLEMDDTIVFQAVANVNYYWRGESKSIYTGAGWERSAIFTGPNDQSYLLKNGDGSVSVQRNDTFSNLFDPRNAETNWVDVHWKKPLYRTVFVPGQLKRMYRINDVPAVNRFNIAAQNDRYTAYVYGTEDQSLSSYIMETEIPRIDVERLRQIKKVDVYSEGVWEFNQLPPSLPKRVRDLALRVTGKADNEYDKVRAVETFLRTGGGFRYETQDVPPSRNKDFVDQFLFETKRGYCDHFSSAMVVLLRASGIPARWVKGYAPGEAVYDENIHRYRITVRNRDAHSWVEVFFPGVGWLPFEPTPGFANPTPVQTPLDDGKERNQSRSSGQEQKSADFLNKKLDQLEQNTETVAHSPTVAEKSSWPPLWERVAFALTILLLFTGAVYFLRQRLVWLILTIYSPSGADSLTRSYSRILRWLERRRLRRKDQTLREFWKERGQPGDAVIRMTKWYEEAVYGQNQEQEPPARQYTSVWKEMMKQIRP